MTARVLGLESPACETLDRVVIRDHPITKGQTLFSVDDPVRYLFLVHSGFCISYSAKDPQQVRGFHLPGELVGIEDIGQKKHSHSATARANGSVCQLDLGQLEDALTSAELIKVQHYLLSATAGHARQLQVERLITGLPNAEQRIAAFLFNLGQRFQSHGFPACRFRLPMSREEIASYLGLAPETVIRTLKELMSKGLIRVRTRQVELLEPETLKQLLIS